MYVGRNRGIVVIVPIASIALKRYRVWWTPRPQTPEDPRPCQRGGDCDEQRPIFRHGALLLKISN